MEIPPVHNMVVQWRHESTTFFNVFDTKDPFYIDLPDGVLTHFSSSYDGYYRDVHNRNTHLYLPVKSTTIDELRLEHPELFI